jgi:hypothetical protein
VLHHHAWCLALNGTILVNVVTLNLGITPTHGDAGKYFVLNVAPEINDVDDMLPFQLTLFNAFDDLHLDYFGDRHQFRLEKCCR